MTKEAAWPKANGLKLTTAAVAAPVAVRRTIPLNVSPQKRDAMAPAFTVMTLSLKNVLDEPLMFLNLLERRRHGEYAC